MLPFNNLEKIRFDLTPFIDPNTELAIEPIGGNNCQFSAHWVQRAEEKNATFIYNTAGEIEHVLYKENKFSYTSFFASPEMADLFGLSRMINQSMKQSTIYIESNGVIEKKSTDSTPSSIASLIHQQISNFDNSTSLVLMVTGDAGAGKTFALQELVKQQSITYSKGESNFLFLYVNAQGRALARLTEAVAAELDELRSRLTFHEVTPLVRLGLIIPIIDGFDELIGVGGYDEAFGSLSNFIDDLNGQGIILTSARSTYYEQEFIGRTAESNQSWTQLGIRVLSWNDDLRQAYVKKYCDLKNL